MDIGYTTADGLAGGLSISTDVIPGKAVLCGTLLGIPNRMFGYELPDLSPSLLFEENFPYPAEARLSDHGWAVDNGVSVQPVTTVGKGLFYTGYISSNIGFSALLRGGAGNRQDVIRPFTETRDLPLYAALLVHAIQLPSVPAPFLEILPATGADPGVLLFIKQAAGGGVQFGVGRSADPDAADYSDVVCPLDSTALVALKHKAPSTGRQDDTLALWVNPPLSLIEPPCDNVRSGMPRVAASVARLRLRQSGTTAFECLVDGIRIGNTWDEAVGRGSGVFSRSVLIVDATDEKQEPFRTLGVADSTVDAFYKTAFQSSADWDALELGPPRIDYMLRHQFVVWHSDHRGGESQPMIASQDVIDLLQQYMDAGGKLLIGGWRHLAWIDNGRPFPREFAPGSFAHDFLHIRVMNETAADTADFLSGEGRSGFSRVTLDPAKLPQPPYEGKLDWITLFPETADSAEVMFAYGNEMQSGRPDYRGTPVAIHSVTPTSDAFCFGFPLYFLPLDQASLLAREVLSRVGVTAVPLGVDRAPDAARPDGFTLGQNFPNPFNPSTTIPFALPERCNVLIEISDPLGRRVALLHEGELDAGTYTARWSPACASGIYFCSMTARRGALPPFRVMRKMVLAR